MRGAIGGLMSKTHPSFDEQANNYDARTGLPAAVCRATVEAAIALAQADQEDLAVEVGAGTGQIGEAFVRSGLRYVGCDISKPMLEVFQRRLSPPAHDFLLVRSDAGQDWPVARETARIIFSARAIHLLSSEHIVQEVWRVAQHGGVFLIGRVERPIDSLKARLREHMRRRMRELGLAPRDAGEHLRRLLGALRGRGAGSIEPLTVATWISGGRPIDVINSWTAKSGLGGVDTPLSIKNKILDDVKSWAEDKFGGLDKSFRWKECFTLYGVRILH